MSLGVSLSSVCSFLGELICDNIDNISWYLFEMSLYARVIPVFALFQMTLYMSVSLVLTWMPYGIAAMWASYSVDWDVVPIWFSTMASVAAKSSCIVEPLVYFFANSRYRQMAWELWPCPDNVSPSNNRKEGSGSGSSGGGKVPQNCSRPISLKNGGDSRKKESSGNQNSSDNSSSCRLSVNRRTKPKASTPKTAWV